MGYNKIIQSGNSIEVFEYEGNLLPCFHRRKKRDRRISQVKARDIRPDNLFRKKRSFTRLVRANLVGEKCPSMFSFTTVGTTDVRLAYGYLGTFFRRLYKSVSKDVCYIAVVEFQKRGAVHFHALVWGLDQQSIEHERDTRFYQHLWQRGYLDCLQTDGDSKLAGYLAKYLGKAMYDPRLLGCKAYSANRRVLRPLFFNNAAAFGYAKDIWSIDLSTDVPMQERIFETKWLGKGRYRLYQI